MAKKILIVTIKKWNIKNFYKLKEKYEEYSFYLINKKDDFTFENINKLKPDFIFFPHWSWKITKEIYENYKSILFHMTDLPFGRGGSPLQNLIIRGIKKTKISAIEVKEGIDSGDIFLKKEVDISLGSAEEILIKISNIIFEEMIPDIIINDIKPKPQKGKVVIFQRRNEEQSDILTLDDITLEKLYDFIRMLDADEYPKAFIKLKDIKIEFSEVHKKNRKIVGRFEIINDEK